MAGARLARFSADAQRARDLVGLGQALGVMTVGVVDASDLYRASLVQVVAGLDFYVHGVVLERAVDMVMGRVPPDFGRSARMGLSLASVEELANAPTAADRELLARGHIAERLTLETFQRPDDIAAALALVGVGACWKAAFGTGAGAAKTALSLVVRRRNRIVHQADMDPLTPSTPTPISADDALDSIATVEITVAGLDAII